MSYLDDPTIHWSTIQRVDEWLDEAVDGKYQTQPLAQDWARVSKVIEELGEAIAELILFTGQNPRKPLTLTNLPLLEELGDVVLTGILAIQHFTKDTLATRAVIEGAILKLQKRIPGKVKAES